MSSLNVVNYGPILWIFALALACGRNELQQSFPRTMANTQGIQLEKANKARFEAERRARAEADWIQLQVGIDCFGF